MEVKKCNYCNEQVLPGLDYIINFNSVVGKLIVMKNRLLPKKAPSRLKLDGIDTNGYHIVYTTHGPKEVQKFDFTYRRDMEYMSKHLSIKSIQGPLCEVCNDQFLSEIKNVLIGFSTKLASLRHEVTKSKIERTISSYNRKIAKLYKRWTKK